MSTLVKELKDALARQTWIDKAAKPVQEAVGSFFQSTGKIGQKLADFLHGVWLGHPLHPVITDIPIGSWTAAVVLDALHSDTPSKGVARSADTAVVLGVTSAVGAAVTGLTDWQHTTGESRRTGLVHAGFNTLALSLFVASLFARGNHNRPLGKKLALFGYLAVIAGGYLGGDLVFRQKIGVNHAPKKIEVPEYEPVLNENELPENHLVRITVKDIPVVLLRRAHNVYALAETCAHLGGPLAEGEIGDDPVEGGPAVTCPWHGSTFNMVDGKVVCGPSTFPQPVFDARLNNGKVEVRYRQEAA
jgi:nitrite reductase/ring-hydroxylating ferredoxin subunit/uncharacterized membrane protein